MNLNLKQIEAFVWVADLKSFRKAASRLNTTQPNISSRIAALERSLNVTLMYRDAGSVRLTSKGEELLLRARSILNAAESFLVSAGDTALIDGVLRLGVTEMIVHTWLRDFMRELKSIYPNVTVELMVDLSETIEKELVARSIDLAFHNGPFNQHFSGTHDLGSYAHVWVAAPHSDIAKLKNVNINAMANESILTHARGTRPFAQIESHFRAYRDFMFRLVPSTNLAACLQLTMDGFGVASAPLCMVKKDLKNKTLVQINYDWVPEDLHFQARYDAETAPLFVAKAAVLGHQLSLAA